MNLFKIKTSFFHHISLVWYALTAQDPMGHITPIHHIREKNIIHYGCFLREYLMLQQSDIQFHKTHIIVFYKNTKIFYTLCKLFEVLSL